MSCGRTCPLLEAGADSALAAESQSRYFPPVPRRAVLPLVTAALLCGCTPGSFVAHQLIRAPNTFPQVVAPEPRVYYTFPDAVLDTLPLQLATVGSPPVTLAYRILPPADYALEAVVTNHPSSSGSRPFYRFRATVPGTPTPYSDHPRGTAVLLHGYGLNQDSMIPWALALGEAGWRCVLVDLRGHGDSGGDRIYFGIREPADLSALLNELERRQQASWPVDVVGVSYGAAVALKWKLDEPRVRTTVAISPYARLGDAIEGLRQDYAAWLPAWLLRGASQRMPALVGAGDQGLDPVDWMRRHPEVVLLVAGGDDDVAPPKAVRDILRAAAPDSSMVEVDGVSHEILPFRFDALRKPITDHLTNGASH